MSSLKEEWSTAERRKRAKKCANPKGFTMKQFCKNIKTRSKKGEKTNEDKILEAVYERLLSIIAASKKKNSACATESS